MLILLAASGLRQFPDRCGGLAAAFQAERPVVRIVPDQRLGRVRRGRAAHDQTHVLLLAVAGQQKTDHCGRLDVYGNTRNQPTEFGRVNLMVV